MTTALVLTSIHPPNEVMRELGAGCRQHEWDFIIAGDSKSPEDFNLDGCRFLSLAEQRAGGHRLGPVSPEKSYTRKNLAYLEAISRGAEIIVETDDDNHPLPGFWLPRSLVRACHPVSRDGWVNAYHYFSNEFIYPRGFPLEYARDIPPVPDAAAEAACPVQQGLANGDPDVDAVYRMLFPGNHDFHDGPGAVLLHKGAWCPFNSQNTTFFREVFPLLYLPAFCSFRMTDIWRSFVCLRILDEPGTGVLFHGPTVFQNRNDHDLKRDLLDEIPGYLNNQAIREELLSLDFPKGADLRVKLEYCYEALIRRAWIGKEEEIPLASWFDDLSALGAMRPQKT